MFNRDDFATRRIVGEKLADILPQGELSALGEQHDADGGELFCQRSQPKRRAGIKCDIALYIGQAICGPEKRFAVFCDDDGCAGVVGLEAARQHRVELVWQRSRQFTRAKKLQHTCGLQNTHQ
jgi:hypothetical protein